MPDVLEALDAGALRAWCAVGLDALEAARAEIDALNVYPVPDGDTGTNLVLTVRSVVSALDAAGPDLAGTARALSSGALLGARGNSGVILSQLLRGLCETLVDAGPDEPGGTVLQRGLARAAGLADAAVAAPVEGTVLTVAREAARGAAQAGEAPLRSVVRAAREAAEQALARTPEQLPALARAGVVDAGGRGLVVLLRALEQVVTGEACAGVPPPLVPRDRSGVAVAREAGSPELAYEVQYLLREATDASADALRARLCALGDSVVVVGGDGLFNVHAHVDDVGAALEAGLDAGRPFRVTVTRFVDQGVGQPAVPPQPRAPQVPAAGRAVVAVVPGPGLARVFREAGARVVEGGPTAGPSTAEVLAAVRAAGVREVVVLPGDPDVAAVARAAADAARSEGVEVAVVPTRAAVQGLAALAVADDSVPLDQAVAGMSRAAAAVRWGEVTRAVRGAVTDAGTCRSGDALGLLEGRVVVVGTEVEQTARQLLDLALAGGGELVTLVLGAEAQDGLGARLGEHVRRGCPAAEVVVYDGGQPHHPVLLGVE